MRVDGITLWDGATERGVSAIQWDGDRIVAVEATAKDPLPELSIIPGLVDTHVHLVGYAGRGHADFATWPVTTTRDEQVLHGVAHAQRAMRRGVTTVRDLAGDEAQIAIRRAFDAGILEGPRVVVSCVVGMTAGHNDLFVPPAVAFQRHLVADGPDECRKLVRTWARAGADGIKICTSGGVLSMGDRNSWRNYTPAEISTVVDEAHALSMPVAAHAHSVAGVQAAIDGGVDSIEHATLLTHAQADAIASAGTPVAPTLLINEAIANGAVPVTDDAREKAAQLVSERDELFRYAAEAGVRFVLGTDANGHHVDFGDEMAEVARMSALFGYGAERSLRAATSDAAEVVGLGQKVGTLAAGYGADFLVMRGRPWRELSDLRTEHIVAVVSRGRVVAGSLPTD